MKHIAATSLRHVGGIQMKAMHFVFPFAEHMIEKAIAGCIIGRVRNYYNLNLSLKCG
jgi:hypothetical protein